MKKEKILDNLIQKVSQNKKYTNLAIIISIGIMILIGLTVFYDNDNGVNKIIDDDDSDEDYSENNMSDYAKEIEIKLKKILSEMEGVGEVEAMVTLVENSESVPATDKTTNKESTIENDAQGGNREVVREENTEKVVITGNQNSMMTLKEVKPEIKGVIIVAQGASDINVKESIYEAVKTVLGLSGNKVEVYVKK
ncbi:hypothetical protein GOQ29_11310 [Clostridium sp. D2Q-14]|uniref:hypothetical protein n=1 Tax=Anaeromonas gelatinilytica TaxID=2683194 RepID=UPI00193BA080|nr:hypothetical protein [Anaeromonas gelatinilytica]MBS4536204.1 hypothetical protein [Anaeromonas gelatinilytica]